ncbi:MAG: hypothetical protein WCE93_13640, partial [Nitrososphaeraceae archaeon]
DYFEGKIGRSQEDQYQSSLVLDSFCRLLRINIIIYYSLQDPLTFFSVATAVRITTNPYAFLCSSL